MLFKKRECDLSDTKIAFTITIFAKTVLTNDKNLKIDSSIPVLFLRLRFNLINIQANFRKQK